MLFAEVLALLDDQERVWVRVGAVLDNDVWATALLEVIAPEPPPTWEVVAWEYPRACFYALDRSGPTVARWLRDGKLSVNGRTITVPQVPPEQDVQVTGNASNASTGNGRLPWPTNSYPLTTSQPLARPADGMLIAAGSPSFFRFGNAVATFLGLVGSGNTDPPSPRFRLQDVSGRITKVHIDSPAVTVTVTGQALAGTVVELASGAHSPAETLSGDPEQVVSFPTPDGLSFGSWVVLKSDTACLDRKFISWPYVIDPDPEVEFATEPVSVVEALRAGGEGPAVEFKREVPSTPVARAKVCRTFAAFANAEGGHLIFGIDDGGEIVGVPAHDAGQDGRDTITRFITAIVVPLISFTVETVETDGGPMVVVVAVHQGQEPAYGVTPAKPLYYVRRGATNMPASADQVRALARSRPPTGVPAAPWLR